jgi:serine/threonine protein kinase
MIEQKSLRLSKRRASSDIGKLATSKKSKSQTKPEDADASASRSKNARDAIDILDPRIGTLVGKYRLEELLCGSSSCSHVYLARNTDTGSEVAVKIPRLLVEKGKLIETEENVRCASEIELKVVARLQENKCNQYHLIKFLESVDVKKESEFVHDVQLLGLPACVYELAPHGMLQDEIWSRNETKTPFSEADICLIMKQMASALLALHACGIGHLDVAPRNIFCTQRMVYKLGDFGGAVFTTGPINNDEILCPAPGSSRRPPEKDRDVGSSDAWGLGVTLLELVTRKLLVSKQNKTKQAKQVKKFHNLLKKSKIYSENLKKLCSDLLAAKPKRCSITQALSMLDGMTTNV